MLMYSTYYACADRASSKMVLTSLSPVSDTTPGQSIRKIRFIRAMYCQTFVSPGIGAALQHFLPIREFMTLDFPVLGYPITPTDI